MWMGLLQGEHREEEEFKKNQLNISRSL